MGPAGAHDPPLSLPAVTKAEAGNYGCEGGEHTDSVSMTWASPGRGAGCPLLPQVCPQSPGLHSSLEHFVLPDDGPIRF